MHLTCTCTVTILLLFSFALVANGLQCYHCRLNLCDHEHCDSAMSLFKESSPEVADYIGVQNWSSITPCPLDWQTASQSGGDPADGFNQTCLNLGDMCGQLVYNITTKSVVNIVSNDSVPVIGSGTNAFDSAVVVLGCIPISHKCRNGFKQSAGLGPPVVSTTPTPSTTAQAAPVAATAPNNSNSSSRLAVTSKLNNLENINTVSNCCHCDTDLCNGHDLITNNGSTPTSQSLQCTSGVGQASFDYPASNGNSIQQKTFQQQQQLFISIFLTPLIALFLVKK